MRKVFNKEADNIHMQTSQNSESRDSKSRDGVFGLIMLLSLGGLWLVQGRVDAAPVLPQRNSHARDRHSWRTKRIERAPFDNERADLR
jgi:hypothetical protein